MQRYTVYFISKLLCMLLLPDAIAAGSSNGMTNDKYQMLYEVCK